jgi:hypothetical protein
LSVNDDEHGEETGPGERAAFAKFLEVISTERGREEFVENPIEALGEEHAEKLPAELKKFLEALTVEELALLHRLCKHTRAAGLFSRHGKITICHL